MGNTPSSALTSLNKQPSGTIVTINRTPSTEMSQDMQPSSTTNTNMSSVDSYTGMTNVSDTNLSSKDVSMADLQRQPSMDYSSRNCSTQFIENADKASDKASIDSANEGEHSAEANEANKSPQHGVPIGRRRSTMIFTDEMDYDQPTTSHEEGDQNDTMSVDGGATPAPSQPPTEYQRATQPPPMPPQPVVVPTIFKWTQGGSKVFVLGTFTGWRKMIALNGPSPKDGSFSVQIALPPGMHRFKFIVDSEIRTSDFIPTATDNSGHFVNYLEIIPSERELYPEMNGSSSVVSMRSTGSHLGLTRDDDDMGNGYTRYHDEPMSPVEKKNDDYIRLIPAIFTDPKVMEEYYVTLDNSQKNGGHSQQWLIPPQLPPHLENVILNSYNSQDKQNTSGALSIPNHVVLNHLATTSIKHSTLAVACVIRYKRKYVTQILYAPL